MKNFLFLTALLSANLYANEISLKVYRLKEIVYSIPKGKVAIPVQNKGKTYSIFNQADLKKGLLYSSATIHCGENKSFIKYGNINTKVPILNDNFNFYSAEDCKEAVRLLKQSTPQCPSSVKLWENERIIDSIIPLDC